MISAEKAREITSAAQSEENARVRGIIEIEAEEACEIIRRAAVARESSCENGTIIRKLTGDNKRQIKKRLRKYAKLVAEGKMTREKFNVKYNSWKNHASHGNCVKLIDSMDEFVGSLFQD